MDIIQKQNLELVSLLKPYFASTRTIDIISMYQYLPGLVGYWPMNSRLVTNGNAFDKATGVLTLTRNGNPVYHLYNNIVSYIDLDGSGDYLSVADSSYSDISGTEAWEGSPGLTIGGWFWADTASATMQLIGKGQDTPSYSLIMLSSASGILFRVRDSGNTANFDVTTSSASALGEWRFVVGRYTPATELKVWDNGTATITTASIPSALWNSTHAFSIGINVGAYFDGRASLCFLCANALPDSLINLLFQQTRGLFGV